MVVDKLDVAALRTAEARGWFASELELAQAGLGPDEYAQRIRKLLAAGVIKSFKTTVAVPPLLGGDWVFGAVMANARRPDGAANLLVKKLPFVTELVFNSGVPDGLGPNLAVTFYSRDFDAAARFVESSVGFQHHEVVKVASYSFSVAQPFSTDERLLIRRLVREPSSDRAALAAALGRDERWIGAKLDRLLWNEQNRSGVLRVQPEIDWSRVENYGHFHFLVETGHRPDQLARLVAELNLRPVLEGRPYRSQWVQLEADIWGIGDLMDRVTMLNQIAGIRVAGVLWNREVLINATWVGPLFE